MIRFLRRLFAHLIGKEVVHFMPYSENGLELSDGDRATLYGWPDKTIAEVTRYGQ